ncbi:uncharacterized protein CANTADRAFT_19503 [Suhomyces tanzawaensis NRRL Y-17324]|uniref:LIM zinc-binding domain-containing protein n=1 Tax=Suhomyces tanzawaensis NRRL Y-17324 TaxID=984487 RepID=A0A1E4SR28_9ASCO|nr:uncharacterized protein CANTADRAFT_19503 [Suhomyces tanzawaensis NRRL Y-17324]ODV81897.1 hypothetical protein CANTADRAFT_19503 [Suhomyces tanzawaensis NRRL Y-17324]
MESFPKFLRSDTHQFKDSAFPPFKVEHRYRGVYERAGFDVNLGGSTAQDSRSIHSKSSASRRRYPTPPKSTSPTSTTSSPLSPHFNPHKGYQTASSTPNISLHHQQPLPPQTKPAKAYGYGYPSNKNPYGQPPQSAPATGSFPDMNRSAPQLRNEYNPSTYSGSAVPPAVPQMASPDSIHHQPYAPKSQGYRPPLDDNFDFSPSSNMSASKNIKNLHLDLNNETPDIDSLSESENEANPLSPKADSFNDTSNTSVDQNYPRGHSHSSSVQSTKKFDPRQKRHNKSASFNTSPNSQKDRLSSALDEFKKDVEVHKTQAVATPPSINVVPPVSESSPAKIPKSHNQHGATHAPYPVDNDFSYGNPVDSPEPSKQFDQFRDQHHNADEGLNTDYQKFLGGGTSKINRTSQLSMVSSIISKDSMYNEEDDEVEKELERQLETLKLAGNSSNIEGNGSTRSVSNDDNSTIQYPPQAASIPVFNIVDADSEPIKTPANPTFTIPTITTTSPERSMKGVPQDEYSLHGGSDSTRSESENMADLDDVSSTASYESVKPLSVRHSHIPPLERRANLSQSEVPYPQEYEQAPRNVSFNDVILSNTPGANRPVNFNDSSPDSNDALDLDDVKPLSPKNHQVEEELKGINFRLAQPTEELDEAPMASPYIPSTTTTTSLPYPVDTPPMRDLVQSSGTFANEEVKYPPGQGPCRKCGLDVLPNARGPQRSIYSKTGELSGQWHRGCFSCNHEGCNISFNKHVQCYAYSDRPYCNHHYHQLNDTICEHCALGIEGECIENEIAQKWHLHCLTCHRCHNTINADYYLINGHIICENDALKIINGGEAYSDENGNLIAGGISTNDKIEKRRTRLLFVE